MKKPKNRINSHRYSTVHDIASHLGVSDRTVERWWSRKLLPAPELGPRGEKRWSADQRTAIRDWYMAGGPREGVPCEEI